MNHEDAETEDAETEGDEVESTEVADNDDVEAVEVELDHDPDGLDLARTMNRVVQGTTPAARKKLRTTNPMRTGRPTGSGPDDRDPQLVKGLLERLIGDHGWDINLRVAGVFARWSELVGSQIGEHSKPESLLDGELTIRTDSTTWATELKLLAPQLVARLNEELGHGTVLTVKLIGPHGPTWIHGRLRAKGRGPRDTYG